MKKLLITVNFALLGAIVLAQDRTTSSGGEATGSGGNVSYTIGLIDYTNNSGTNGNIHEGVQQPIEFYTVNVDEWNMNFSISVFPNPASDQITISVPELTEGLKCTLTDVNGRIVKEIMLNEVETTLNIVDLSTASYFLSIYSNDQVIQNYKLVKH